MCPACHGVKQNGEHSWEMDKVLAFLVSYFDSDRLLPGTIRLIFCERLRTHLFRVHLDYA